MTRPPRGVTDGDGAIERVRGAIGDALGRAADETAGCRCEAGTEAVPGPVEATALRVDAGDCPDGGDLVAAPGCRARVVRALDGRGVDAVVVEDGGRARRYAGDGVAALVAASRFAEAAAGRDPALAARARTDPLGAAREADGRAGPLARLAAETGLAEAGERFPDYGALLTPRVGLVVGDARFERSPPPEATLCDRTELSTGTTVRRYRREDGRKRYHLTPPALSLSAAAVETLSAAADRLAATGAAPAAAVEAVVGAETGENDSPGSGADGGGDADGTGRGSTADSEASAAIPRIAAVLEKHARGAGVLADCFADPRVSDAYLTAPTAANPLRVVVDDEPHETNAAFGPAGAAALASRLRAASGRSFSRSSPRIDATLSTLPGGPDVRVAGTAPPLSDGFAFAVRRRDEERPWTLPRLLSVGSLPPAVAGLLSVAVERGAAVLIAGPRGAGKTTTLGALLWELPASARTVVVEDTAELPVPALQRAGRDVQRLSVAAGVDGDAPGVAAPTALRSALRLGGGALVVGEVRGEEAGVLYEAMRIGAADEAVLGTIHGEGAAGVAERVVSDLGVAPRAFGATDLVVTLGRADGRRRVTRVEEVRANESDAEPSFATLYDYPEGTTSLVDRGDSAALAALSGPDEGYAAVRAAAGDRAEALATLADRDRDRPADRA